MQWHAISMRVEVEWKYTCPHDASYESTGHLGLSQCPLAKGQTERQKTKCIELESMSDFVNRYVGMLVHLRRLRDIGLDETEISEACHLRTSAGKN